VCDDIAEHEGARTPHDYYEMTPAEKQEMWFKKLNYIWFQMPEKRKRYFIANPNLKFQWFWIHKGQTPGLYHWVMFRTAVSVCSNEEQRKKWMPLIDAFDIIGCYGQTELGHGSDIMGLQTTALYDKAKKEFVINTPCIEATKWWPGDMGRTANYALVAARIQVPEDDGEINDYGLGMFLVQCRNRDTHMLMPGIKAGELGPKLGYTSKDNGWMTFDHVRISKDMMLQNFMTIDDDGCFELKGDPRSLYIVMLRTRVVCTAFSWLGLFQAIVVAVRYSIVRRQFKNISGKKEETQLIDYQTQ
jgi:acyl-CoA oxidase